MKSKILLIGIDGLNLNSAFEASPAIAALKDTAYFSELTMQPPTWSGPSWSTLLTGTTHEQHGVRDNSFMGHRLLYFPDLLSLAYYQDQSTSTFAAAGWPPLVDPAGHAPVIQERREQQKAFRHRVIVRDGETYGYTLIDAQIQDAALYAISHHGPDVSFVYFCGVDEAGHVYGSVGPEYKEAIARIDNYVENLLKAVQIRSDQGEPWLVVITTDHGHLDAGGHGGDTPQERASFVFAQGFGRPNPTWPQRIEPHDLTPLLIAERAG